jgi:putative transposase
MHSIKRNFTKYYKEKNNITNSLSLWQKRFWDHVIRDEDDLENHLHYIHFNPVKHGYVKDPAEWNDSSFKAWQIIGLYPKDIIWNEPEDSSWGE